MDSMSDIALRLWYAWDGGEKPFAPVLLFFPVVLSLELYLELYLVG